MPSTPYIISLDSLSEAEALQRRLGVTEEGIRIMAPKAASRVVRVDGLTTRAASILKQEALSIGAEVALPRSAYELKGEGGPALIMGTTRRLRRLGKKLAPQPFGLSGLGERLRRCVDSYEAGRNGELPLPPALGEAPWLIMGILNVTPDSFSDGGLYSRPDAARRRAEEMVEAGAGIIDIGGESSRPEAEPVSLKEELARVLPVVEAAAGLGVPVSIDTRKAEVARRALEAGATVINDITALNGDPEMAQVAAAAGCPVCLMHMQGTPETMQKQPRYDDVVAELIEFFAERAAFAEEQGIRRENLVLDPGIGFGKQLEHNLAILNHLDSFLSLGRPLLLGASRKSFIGQLTGAGSSDRLPGTVAANVLAYQRGARIFRVHDVAVNHQALTVAAGIGGAA